MMMVAMVVVISIMSVGMFTALNIVLNIHILIGRAILRDGGNAPAGTFVGIARGVAIDVRHGGQVACRVVRIADGASDGI